METGPSRMCVRLANLQPETQQSILELLGQPRARCKPTNEECELLLGDQAQEQSLRVSKRTNRIDGKFLAKFIPNAVHGGLDRGLEEPRNL